MGKPKNRCTIGTDPEFFLVDGKGKMVSAIPHIKGTKHEPVALPSGGTVQRDNVALEFATPPANDGPDFVDKVRKAFADIMGIVPKDCSIRIVPSAIFDADQLDCPEALEFGCDPDYNAWTLSENEKPTHDNPNFRSCGGHIHVGHVAGDGNDFLLDPYGKIETTKGMDCFHGIISVLLDNSPESIERRKLYGGSGCHRPTPYGVEYRVLSNFWMKSPHLVMLMDSLTQDVLKIMREEKLESLLNKVGEEQIRSIIDSGEVDKAKEILETVLMPEMSEDSKHYLEECLGNIENYDFMKEWQLEVAAK